MKDKDIIPENGEVNINDLPVGGYRRYETLECLSDVPYRGRMEKAYWKYTDDRDHKDHKVDDIRCKDECKSPDIGWRSTLGIYKNKTEYYGVVRLGRHNEAAAAGVFTCHFEGDSDGPVSVKIVTMTVEREDIIILGFIKS